MVFAAAARNLGKYRLARQIIDDLLCEPPTAEVLIPALVLSSSLWRGLGAPDVALALIRQAAERLPGERTKEHAWVLHQQAKLFLETGQIGPAEKTLQRALATYRHYGDTYGEIRALLLRVAIHEAKGDPRKALQVARLVIKLSTRHEHARGVVFGLLELGRVLAGVGKTEAAVENLTQGLGNAVRLKDNNAQFVAHYHLWKIHLETGNHDRGRFELNAAKYFVQFVDERSPEADEVSRLAAKRGKP